jgi:hypothetical protein
MRSPRNETKIIGFEVLAEVLMKSSDFYGSTWRYIPEDRTFQDKISHFMTYLSSQNFTCNGC